MGSETVEYYSPLGKAKWNLFAELKDETVISYMAIQLEFLVYFSNEQISFATLSNKNL